MKYIKLVLIMSLAMTLASCANSNANFQRDVAGGFFDRLFNFAKRPNLSVQSKSIEVVTIKITSGGLTSVRSYNIFRNSKKIATLLKNQSGMIFSDKAQDLKDGFVPGKLYRYHVKANADGDDGRSSNKVAVFMPWNPSDTTNHVITNVDTPEGYGVQYNRGKMNRSGKWVLDDNDAKAIMYVGGNEVICEVRGGSDGDLYNVQYVHSNAYEQLVDKRRQSMAAKHGGSWNEKSTDGRRGIKGCRELIENNRQYTDNAPDDKFLVPVITYKDGKICKVKRPYDVKRVPLGYYAMLRRISGTLEVEDGNLPVCK